MGTHHNNNGAPPMENLYFFEDEVFKIDKRGRVKFGVIIGSAELISDEEDEDYVDPGEPISKSQLLINQSILLL